jgi:hypothetical protein
MGEKNLTGLIEQLVESTLSEGKRLDMENQLQNYPNAYEEYKAFLTDYISAGNSNEIADNPYLAAKIRERVASDNHTLPVIRKVAWAPYAVLASLGISFGIFLGFQVDKSSESSADFITEEFIVSDYDVEGLYIVDFNE